MHVGAHAPPDGADCYGCAAAVCRGLVSNLASHLQPGLFSCKDLTVVRASMRMRCSSGPLCAASAHPPLHTDHIPYLLAWWRLYLRVADILLEPCRSIASLSISMQTVSARWASQPCTCMIGDACLHVVRLLCIPAITDVYGGKLLTRDMRACRSAVPSRSNVSPGHLAGASAHVSCIRTGAVIMPLPLRGLSSERHRD